MLNYFVRHKIMSTILASCLVLTTTNFACNTSWISTVGQYLPTAIQIAESIIQLVGMFGSSSAQSDQAAVQAIGQEATKDYQLLQTLYQQYQATPSPTTQAQIENILAIITTNLPAELAAAHIKDQGLLNSVTAAVNTLVTIADTIISQLPVKSPQLKARKGVLKSTNRLTPAGAKQQWDTLVCKGLSTCTALVH